MRKIVFITGTRADYGKLKPLMKVVESDSSYECYIFVSGMHLIERYGNTYNEIIKDSYKNIYVAYGLQVNFQMDVSLGSVIQHFSGYVQNIKPDMIVVHGDRIDALGGAIVGALNNILVAHVEGGEISGTIDESIRHAVSKFAHIHFVANEEAKRRLIQLGEEPEYIYVIGSPDIDVMLCDNLPPLDKVKEYYGINFDRYGIFMYHPVTTEYNQLDGKISEVIRALEESCRNFVIIYPNNDTGSELIINAINRLSTNAKFAVFPSIRFEYFLTLLKNSDFIIGNSSAGVREACVYGLPTIDIGSRQQRRYDIEQLRNIQSVNENAEKILNAIWNVENHRVPSRLFGSGDSAMKFIEVLQSSRPWNNCVQKQFIDLEW